MPQGLPKSFSRRIFTGRRWEYQLQSMAEAVRADSRLGGCKGRGSNFYIFL